MTSLNGTVMITAVRNHNNNDMIKYDGIRDIYVITVDIMKRNESIPQLEIKVSMNATYFNILVIYNNDKIFKRNIYLLLKLPYFVITN